MSTNVHAYIQKSFYGGGTLLLIAISVLFKRNIWVYLFALTLVLNFFEVILLHPNFFSFQLGAFNFNLTTVLLLVLHFALNAEAFLTRKKTT